MALRRWALRILETEKRDAPFFLTDASDFAISKMYISPNMINCTAGFRQKSGGNDVTLAHKSALETMKILDKTIKELAVLK